MTGVLKKELETILAIFVVTGICVVLLMHYKAPQQHIFVPTLPPLLTTPTPTTSHLPATQTVSAQSPDGSYTLFMKKQPTTTNITYSFSVSQTSQDIQKPLYTTITDISQTYTIPFNTWAPDDKYIFLKEKTSKGEEYYVLPITGGLVTEPITIHDKFVSRYPDLTISDVTGWAGPGLLIVNTTTKNGESGPSFWFDVINKSFIQLSTKFY